jgi:microcystin-dependent protein
LAWNRRRFDASFVSFPGSQWFEQVLFLPKLPFLGQIMAFAGNFAPKGWAFCHGQLLNIADYEPLFQLIGTTFGGDGQNTFALPDHRGKMVVGATADKPLGATSEYPAAESGNHVQKTLDINHIICLNGIFPSPN